MGCVTNAMSRDESIAPVPTEGSGNQKTVAVTGANGFIGSRIVKDLLEKGYKVRGTVQDLDPAKVDFLNDLTHAENLTLFKGELLDEGCFDNAFEGCDCVFHLASPTLKDQREMKNPEEEMIHQAVSGTINVLTSCANTGVKCVVLTSSMCAATQKIPCIQELIHEDHWADHNHMINKGSYYAASKILKEKAALDFVSNMSKESAFRLVILCPSFTVGPMLQPAVNSSMDRFASICHGIHHEQIPNRSISLIDVRDVAQHHIAAYEKGLKGRYLSTTESWHWTKVYDELKKLRPEMICPTPLPKGTEHRSVRKYSKRRMKHFGVMERSFSQTLFDAVEEVDTKKLTGCNYPCKDPGSADLVVFVPYCGYYDLGSGDGTFFMIEVFAHFAPKQIVTYSVSLFYLLQNWDIPTQIKVPIDSAPYSFQNVYNTSTLNWREEDIVVDFIGNSSSWPRFRISGLIGGKSVAGNSGGGGCAVPFNQFAGTYTGTDGKTVTIALYESGSYIKDYDDVTTYTFVYSTLKRQFSYTDADGTLMSRLYMNVEAGRGFRLTFTRFDEDTIRSTKYFYYNNNPQPGPDGPVIGATELASRAGFYPLVTPGSFVSITGSSIYDRTPSTPTVTLCTSEKYTTEYTSYTFDGKTLRLADQEDLPLEFSTNYDIFPSDVVTYNAGSFYTSSRNLFSEVPLEAFGTRIFTGETDDVTYSMLIVNAQLLVFKKGNEEIYKGSDFEYNTLGQYATVVSTKDKKERRFFFTFNGLRGATCAVTFNPGLEVVLYVIPSGVTSPHTANA